MADVTFISGEQSSLSLKPGNVWIVIDLVVQNDNPSSIGTGDMIAPLSLSTNDTHLRGEKGDEYSLSAVGVPVEGVSLILMYVTGDIARSGVEISATPDNRAFVTLGGTQKVWAQSLGSVLVDTNEYHIGAWKKGDKTLGTTGYFSLLFSVPQSLTELTWQILDAPAVTLTLPDTTTQYTPRMTVNRTLTPSRLSSML